MFFYDFEIEDMGFEIYQILVILKPSMVNIFKSLTISNMQQRLFLTNCYKLKKTWINGQQLNKVKF